MRQQLPAGAILNLAFTCLSTIEVDDDVIISASKTVIKNNAAGSLKRVGRVAKHRSGDTECTVDTRFLIHDDARVSGAEVHVGPVVLDAACKIIDYDPDVHDPFAIIGIAITPTTGADLTVETLEF